MKLKREKGHTGKKKSRDAVGQYVSRAKALRMLQINMFEFRRLCILKGVYPRDPGNKVSARNKTYYLTKDIKFLMHEPVIDKLREIKSWMKKIKKSVGRKEYSDAKRRKELMPIATIDHIIRERYPTFMDAVRDLDDALSMIHLFAALPAKRGVPADWTEKCMRLSKEFQYYVVRTHALRKSFVSIKGIYYQAEIFGNNVTWLVPHSTMIPLPGSVDMQVMSSFLELYIILLKFVNFRLFHHIGLSYPPVLGAEAESTGNLLAALTATPAAPTKKEETSTTKKSKKEKKGGDESSEEEDQEEEGVDSDLEEDTPEAAAAREERMKALEDALNKIGSSASAARRAAADTEDKDDDDLLADFPMTDDERKVYLEKRVMERAFRSLFKGCKFFLGREVPRSSLEFIIRSFGGQVSYDGVAGGYTEQDPTITHQIIDRPGQALPKANRVKSREYVQPQWIYDCVNARVQLPVQPYGIGKAPPPHLSPFVDDEKEGYVPEQALKIRQIVQETLARQLAQFTSSSGQQTPGAASGSGAMLDEEEKLATEEAQYLRELELERKQAEGKADTTTAAAADKPEETEEKAAEEEEEEEQEESLHEAIKKIAANRSGKKTRAEVQAEEELELRKMMMTNKVSKFYNHMKKGIKRKQRSADALLAKRQRISESESASK